jgi:RNA 3'-terminal phosphate cyclase-like protein
MAQNSALLSFSGHQYLRHRLVLSILSGKAVKIDGIRPDDKNPGLRGQWPPANIHSKEI